MTTLTIGMAQVAGSIDPQENLAKAREYTRQAADKGAGLVVFPEMFMALPEGAKSLEGVAEPLNGPFVSELAGMAREAGIFLCAGIWEQSGEVSKVYNTAVVLSSQGEVVSAYRKLHLFDALAVRESDRMVAGSAAPSIFIIDGIRLGLAICYDLRFPELFRELSEQGVDGLIIPAAWYAGPLKEEMWLTLLRARAIENVCYAAGAVLTEAPFAGRSAAFDPFGVPLADAGETQTLVTFTIHRERIKSVRQKLPALDHRRRDIYA